MMATGVVKKNVLTQRACGVNAHYVIHSEGDHTTGRGRRANAAFGLIIR